MTNSERATNLSIYAIVILLLTFFSSGVYASGSIHSAKALRSMVRLNMAYGNYDNAEILAHQALVGTRTQSSDNSEIALCLMDLATVYQYQGKLNEAEKYGIDGIALMKSAYYEEHPYVGYALRNLANILRQQRNLEEAKQTITKALDIIKTTHPSDSSVIAAFKVDMAAIFAEMGDFVTARQCYDHSLSIMVPLYGRDHLLTNQIFAGIARLYYLQGHYIHAEILLSSVIETQQKIYKDKSFFLVPSWLQMAQIKRARGNYHEATILLGTALSALHGREHPLKSQIFDNLTDIHMADASEYRADKVIANLFNINQGRAENFAFHPNSSSWVSLYIH